MVIITIRISKGKLGLFSNGTEVGTVTLAAKEYGSELYDIGTISHTNYVRQTTGIFRSKSIGKIVPDRDSNSCYTQMGIYVCKEGMLLNSYKRVGTACVYGSYAHEYSCKDGNIYYKNQKIGYYFYEYGDRMTPDQKDIIDAYAAAGAYLLISPNHL